ncbi:MAG: Ig domain-containing protein, partial [Gemmatimonadales bacterium]
MKTASRVGLIALGSIPTVLLWACDRRQADVPTGPTEVVVASVEVTPAGQVLTALGGTLQLAAVAKDAQGTTLSGKTFSWTSSATDVATVNASGVVTAVGNGTATIRATTDDVSGSVTVKVQQEPAQLSIRTQPSGAASGQPFVSQPAIEVQDANGNVVTI